MLDGADHAWVEQGRREEITGAFFEVLKDLGMQSTKVGGPDPL